MVAKRKKKYSAGEGAQFMSRKSALKKLQLSIKDFRRLCILKGIYPREPRNRKRAQKGAGGIKTLYHTKDIQFLMHEPIIWKLRDVKIYYRRIKKAQGLKDKNAIKRYLNNYPEIKFDHIIKERYPTFIDALRDIDDCLTLCFLFSTFPSIKHVPRDRSVLCRRLTVEFMHAVIAANALRKVFVSIKGYYYQAEIKGQIINWIVPHHFGFQPHSKDEVDFKLMATFVEFFTVMLGFVNFRLFHSLNLQYPPSLLQSIAEADKELVDEDVYVSERVAAMNTSLSIVNSGEPGNEINEIDQFPTDEDPQKLEEARQEADKVKNLKTMFKGLKFFINREVPRESMVFLIRCFGGDVSWDKILFVGSTFDESDESITHQIVDRPKMDKQYISRYYVQPQWVFDSVNARALLPVSKYLMGATLPPHLSPFTDKEKDQVYIPPEAREISDNLPMPSVDKADDSEEESAEEDAAKKPENDLDDDAYLEQVYNEEIQEDSDSLEDSDDDGEEKLMKKKRQKKQLGMAVTPGEVAKEIPFEKNRQDKQDFQLREKMIKKKHRRLYKSMMEGKKKRMKEIYLLRKKRKIHDAKEKEEKKQTKKSAKQAVTA